MNPFEAELRRAQVRQHRLYILGFAGLVLAALAVIAGLLFANGTAITIAPDEAAENGTITVVSGRAVAFADAVYSLSGTPRILLRAPGFRDQTLILQPKDRGRRISVTLEPLPGRIAATARPLRDDTVWLIDGRAAGVGAAMDREVEAGTRTLRAESPWHPAVERPLTVGKGETVELVIDLPPLRGRFDILSEPPGATVSVDGETAGLTPLKRNVAGGRFALAVTLDGYETINETVEITRSMPVVKRRYLLKPVAATLMIAVEPAGGDLLLDGRRIEPRHDYAVASDRDHTVTYVRPGWRGEHKSVRLAPGEARRLVLRLAPDTGIVEINSDPPATVLVDGKPAGEGRVTLALPAVEHRIELRRPGYRTISRTVTPRRDRPVVVRETLLPELQARIAEAPRTYRNAAGIEMVLFEPYATFTMGAPRGQEGQRANEFERRVRLTKRFYASRHEITNGQFRQFRGGRNGADNLPVTGVSWRDAAAFCNWLSERDKLTPFYRMDRDRPVLAHATADGYRLLSEAEWEWLARKAGRPQKTIFTWGDETVVPRQAGNIADEAANGVTRYYVPNYRDGHARLAPVGSYPPEPSGLQDMTGNASEWVHDYYMLIPPRIEELVTDPLGPPVGDSHVVKGSSWRSGTRTTLRAAFRDGLAEPRDDVGFRIGRYLYGAEDNASGGAGAR